MAQASGETNVPVSEWTTGTLKIHQDDRISGVERIALAESKRLYDLHVADFKRLDEQIDALGREFFQDKQLKTIAQDKFEATVQRDAVKQNEFRGSLDDLSKSMATKTEMGAALKNIDDKFAEHGKQLSDLRSRLDVGNPAIGTIQQQLAVSSGRQSGSDVTIGKIYAAIGAVGAILGVLVLLSNGVFK